MKVGGVGGVVRQCSRQISTSKWCTSSTMYNRYVLMNDVIAMKNYVIVMNYYEWIARGSDRDTSEKEA